MTVIINPKENPKKRIGFSMKKKTFKILLIAIVLAILSVTGYLSLKPKETKLEQKYNTVEEALYTNLAPNQLNQIKDYKKASEYYRNGQYKEAADLSLNNIKNGISEEMVSNFYSMAYSSYLKLDDLESAIEIIKQYQKTSTYKKIPEDSANSWDLDLEKLYKGINPQEEREKLEDAS